MAEFINFLSVCGGDERFRSCANFSKHYAPLKLRHCALKILHRRREQTKEFQNPQDALNTFFSVGLNINCGLLDYSKMYDYIKNVEFHFRTPTNSDVAKNYSQSLRLRIFYLDQTLNSFRGLIMHKVNIVNVARGVGCIKESDLTSNLHLTNEHVRLAAQMNSQKAYKTTMKNFDERYSEAGDQLDALFM